MSETKIEPDDWRCAGRPVAPATDEEIDLLRKPRYTVPGHRGLMSLIARIDAEKAKANALSARCSELEIELNLRNAGTTHSEECWRWHHECARTRIADLEARLAEAEQQMAHARAGLGHFQAVLEKAEERDPVDHGEGG
jgi:hypothetical protein